MNNIEKFQDVRELSEDLLRYIDLIEVANVRNDSIDYAISLLNELKVEDECLPGINSKIGKNL